MGLGPAMLRAFAPDLALTLAAVLGLLGLPAALRALSWLGRARSRGPRIGPG